VREEEVKKQRKRVLSEVLGKVEARFFKGVLVGDEDLNVVGKRKELVELKEKVEKGEVSARVRNRIERKIRGLEKEIQL